jgi:hypothetical protein
MQVASGTDMCGIVVPSLSGSYSAAFPMTSTTESGEKQTSTVYCTAIKPLVDGHEYSLQFPFRMVGKNVATTTTRQVRASDASTSIDRCK